MVMMFNCDVVGITSCDRRSGESSISVFDFSRVLHSPRVPRMFRRTTLFLVIACLIAGVIYTYKTNPKSDNAATDGAGKVKAALSQNHSDYGYFKTHFQDESQF